MRYTSVIDNVHAQQWGLSIQEAYLFDWLYSLPSWATSSIVNGDEYYFASRTKACQELPLISNKADTMYRYYKSLEEKGLILVKKIDGMDYVQLTDKAKEWGRQSERSEKNPDLSENIPKKPGKKSDILVYNILGNKDSTCETEVSLFPDAPPVSKKEGSITYKKIVDFWLKEFHPGWSFGAVHGKAIKSIIKKIVQTFKENKVEPTDDEIIEFFSIMCRNLPDWYKNKDLQVIDSKYNEIVSQIMGNGNKRTTEDWIKQHYGIRSAR